jgi:hypothetical protein
MVTRRSILTVGAAAAAISATGAVLYGRGPGEAVAREPWRKAGGSFGDPRLDALAFAILAPNPHNRQPWRFELNADRRIIVRCDLNRLLPETDPYSRQITIGFGAMLELLQMAAAEKGFSAEITAFPEGFDSVALDDRPVAFVDFLESDAEPDPLFRYALQRRTNRSNFTADIPPASVVEDLGKALNATIGFDGTVDETRVASLADLAKRAWRIEYENDATRRESINLIRVGNREIAANPDGIAISGTAMGLLRVAGVLSPKNLDTPGKMAFETGLNSYLENISTSRGFVWLTTKDNSRASQITAGRSWVRINLAATSIGLAVHPLSQALQEFPEMAAPYAEIHDMLGDGGTVQMFGRIGYASAPPPSPRFPLEAKLFEPNA